MTPPARRSPWPAVRGGEVVGPRGIDVGVVDEFLGLLVGGDPGVPRAAPNKPATASNPKQWVRAASRSAGTRHTRSASVAAVAVSTSRRAPAPPAATPPPASASTTGG